MCYKKKKLLLFLTGFNRGANVFPCFNENFAKKQTLQKNVKFSLVNVTKSAVCYRSDNIYWNPVWEK